MSALQKAIPVTIAAGASLSNGALLGDHTLVGIQMPATWTPASLTFQISYDDGATWHNLYDDGGNEVTLSPNLLGGVSQYLAVSPDPFGGIVLIAVRSGTQAAPVNQVSAAALTLITRKFFPVR